MGGHGHGHETYKVPSPDVYKVEDVPELKKLQEKLAERGLKDPWLRNEVWRYTAFSCNKNWEIFRTLTRGFIIGIPAFLITIGLENAFGISYAPAHHDEGGHDEGGHDDHH